MSKYGLLMDAEEITMEVSCALKGLRIIREQLEDELFSIKKSGIFPGVGYMQELCDAKLSWLGSVFPQRCLNITLCLHRITGSGYLPFQNM